MKCPVMALATVENHGDVRTNGHAHEQSRFPTNFLVTCFFDMYIRHEVSRLIPPHVLSYSYTFHGKQNSQVFPLYLVSEVLTGNTNGFPHLVTSFSWGNHSTIIVEQPKERRSHQSFWKKGDVGSCFEHIFAAVFHFAAPAWSKVSAFESMNEMLSAIHSHFSYWENEASTSSTSVQEIHELQHEDVHVISTMLQDLLRFIVDQIYESLHNPSALGALGTAHLETTKACRCSKASPSQGKSRSSK